MILVQDFELSVTLQTREMQADKLVEGAALLKFYQWKYLYIQKKITLKTEYAIK